MMNESFKEGSTCHLYQTAYQSDMMLYEYVCQLLSFTQLRRMGYFR